MTEATVPDDHAIPGATARRYCLFLLPARIRDASGAVVVAPRHTVIRSRQVAWRRKVPRDRFGRAWKFLLNLLARTRPMWRSFDYPDSARWSCGQPTHPALRSPHWQLKNLSGVGDPPERIRGADRLTLISPKCGERQHSKMARAAATSAMI